MGRCRRQSISSVQTDEANIKENAAVGERDQPKEFERTDQTEAENQGIKESPGVRLKHLGTQLLVFQFCQDYDVSHCV